MKSDTILQFSGGKDSLACLFLYKEKWNDLTVVFCNTGAAYPDTLKLIEWVKQTVPNFIEVKSDQPSFVEKYGYPVDIVPTRFTDLGREFGLKQSFITQSYFNCCYHNIWKPLQQVAKELRAKTIIRGQRLDESRKSKLRDLDVVDGILYRFPIQSWSKQDVFDYLKKIDAPIPKYYESEMTSHDCWSCTAYLDENLQRIKNLPVEKKFEVLRRLNLIHGAIYEEMENLNKCLT